MADLNELPSDWKTTAIKLCKTAAEKYKFMGVGVWLDDDCPLQLSVIIIDENQDTFRINEPSDELLDLLKTPKKLRIIYNTSIKTPSSN